MDNRSFEVISNFQSTNNIKINDINQEVIDYFQSLGYDTDWDVCRGVKYHTIFTKEGKLVLQIDMNIPLNAIKKDLIKERDNQGEGSGYEYIISGAPCLELTELLDKIQY